MKEYRRICANISLKALEHNLDAIHDCIDRDTKIIAVVKADGYGHGAVPLTEVMEQREDVWGYAVATPEEAEELYSNGIKKPILILGYTFPEYDEQIVKEGLRPAVFSLERAKQLSEEAVRQNKECKIHIKLDTGMSRIGFQVTEQSADEIAQIAASPNIIIEGIFTHFSKADETDKTFTKKQADTYEQMITWLKDRQIEIPIHHISNSAGIVDLPEYNKDIVRAGIILYGLWPSDEVEKNNIDLKPLLSLKSHVVHVKELEPGRIISYGGTFEVEKPMQIATVPVGYADGYPRSLSNKGYVLIHGKRAAICGRVCMDQMMVDVSEIPDVKPGDEVTLIGTDGTETITMEELGDMSGRFNYELACDLNKRIPRIYY
ncbi:alanine racemase [Eubacterium ramulus]|uniref:alanine racemase n=1 Tax=Eubacterium ramulus TaxID=39490 RepID=UPI0022E28EFC|nr:alanine racemase [Eubacterium ramulus]